MKAQNLHSKLNQIPAPLSFAVLHVAVVNLNLFYMFSLWPTVVRERVRDTYAYFGGSLIFTAGSAIAISRSPRMMNLMMRSSWVVSTMQVQHVPRA